MRLVALAALIVLAIGARIDGADPCGARVPKVAAATLHWIEGPAEDRAVLAQWCRGVGPPIFVREPAEPPTEPPDLRDLVIVTWNAHLHEGRLEDLIEDLRDGELTGTPVRHFVLLVQELFRRGPMVPPFDTGVRSARAIRGEDEDEHRDAAEYAASLGLSMLYVPSMRNGAELFEDRGNAILSTMPLANAFSMELPVARQRRVAVGGSIDVLRDGFVSTLRLMNVHLEPLSSPRALWFFRNPRTRQADAILDLVNASRFEQDVTWAGTVIGGDFNTVKAGIDEPAYRDSRTWGYSTAEEDHRATHRLGRLDYLFFRLPSGWSGITERLSERFGSDHHPVLGRFSR